MRYGGSTHNPVHLGPHHLYEEKLERLPESGCWVWMGALCRDGYGRVSVFGRVFKAHRLIYERAVGPIRDGAHVLHRCDVPCCVNPAHLFLGSHKDNMRDMASKSRTTAKFSPEDVRLIRASEESHASLGRRFGADPRLISKIRARLTYKHIP